MPYTYACASFHVEDVVSDQQAIEAVPVGEAEEVYQEQPQESEVAEEDQEFGTDFANFYNTQGKPRFIWKPSIIHNRVLQLLLYLCI